MLSNKSTSPPKLAQRFLHFFLKEELAEEVMGDLEDERRVVLQSQNEMSSGHLSK